MGVSHAYPRKHPKDYASNVEYIKMLARLIRTAGRRIGQDDPEMLAALCDLQVTLAQAIQTAVEGQRATGITWRSIGEATGTTKEAAVQKWGPSRVGI